MKKKNIYNLLLYAGIFAGAVLITLTYCLLQGSLGALRNDSTFYIEQAKGILSNGLFYYGAHISTPYYWGYPTFLAICMAFVGENWVAIAIIQVLLSACSTVFLFFILCDILNTPRYTRYSAIDSPRGVFCVLPAAALALFYRAILDVSIWNGLILSDGLGMTLECMTLYYFYFSFKDRKKKDYVLLAVFSLLFFTVRTNAISLLLVVAVTCLLSLPKDKRRIAVITAVFAVAAVVAVLYIVGMDARHGLRDRVDYYRNYFLQGVIVLGRPEYDYQIPASHKDSLWFVFDILNMFLKKVIFYWNIYFNTFSKVHIVLCFLTILPTFLFTLFSVVCIVRDKAKQLYPFVAGILSYNLLQSATELDFSNRYRSPVFLLLIICSAYGMRKLYRLAERRKTG